MTTSSHCANTARRKHCKAPRNSLSLESDEARIFSSISEALNIPYGQRVAGGWTIHDIRHTCLTHLALNGMPLHGIKEYAGHASIVETQRYLKYMPQQIELGANISSRLAELANAKTKPAKKPHDVECPNCGHAFNTKKPRHLKIAGQASP
jgi:integrase